MSSLDADLKKYVDAIVKIEAKKAKRTEQELDAYYHIASIRIGCQKPRCYC